MPTHPIQLVIDETTNSSFDRAIEAIPIAKKYIPRYYIRVEEVSRDQIKQLISTDHPPTEFEIETEYQDRKDLKKELREWSRNRIRQIQYEEAKKQGMDVRSWEEIGDCWQKDGSRINQERMFQVMHGVFERKGKWKDDNTDNTWSMQLEEEFMTEYDLAYDMPEPEKKASRK